MKKVTMDDIAAEMNISKSLVSLAIGGKYGVSEETRAEIVLKAAEMGYELPAKRRKNEVKNITLLLRKMSDLSSQFWREIIKGAQNVLLNKKVYLNVTSWNDLLGREDVVLSLYGSHTQGILVLNRCDRELMDMISGLRIPTVLIDFLDYAENKYSQVRANNYLGGYEAAKYLVSLGHKKLIFFGNNHFSYSFHQRYHGFYDFIDGCGGEITASFLTGIAEGAEEEFQRTGDESLVICDPQELKAELAKGESTAVMCANDAIAKCAFDVMEQLDLAIGTDISLMTFDNTKMCERVNPTLTSINIPKAVMGKKAVELLFSLIENGDEFPTVVEVNTEIVVRNSVRDLRQ